MFFYLVRKKNIFPTSIGVVTCSFFFSFLAYYKYVLNRKWTLYSFSMITLQGLIESAFSSANIPYNEQTKNALKAESGVSNLHRNSLFCLKVNEFLKFLDSLKWIAKKVLQYTHRLCLQLHAIKVILFKDIFFRTLYIIIYVLYKVVTLWFLDILPLDLCATNKG